MFVGDLTRAFRGQNNLDRPSAADGGPLLTPHEAAGSCIFVWEGWALPVSATVKWVAKAVDRDSPPQCNRFVINTMMGSLLKSGPPSRDPEHLLN